MHKQTYLIMWVCEPGDLSHNAGRISVRSIYIDASRNHLRSTPNTTYASEEKHRIYLYMQANSKAFLIYIIVNKISNECESAPL